jgi:L-lysine exporter family protein LysE/ArgO
LVSSRLKFWMLILGGVFLFVQSAKAFLESRTSKSLAFESSVPLEQKSLSFFSVATMTIGMSLLNPHVYSDTILIMGNISATIPKQGHLMLLLGASFGSCIWFGGLGFSGHLMSTFLSRPVFWKWANLFVSLSMLIFGILFWKEALYQSQKLTSVALPHLFDHLCTFL